MPIIVNTNIPSINAQRALTIVNRKMDKALARLASGLRINRAGDDAAGLAIANGLQTQVRGLTQAVRNAQDGLSVAGAAEGAVTQQTNILQRIRELSIQAASDINSAANLQQIQDEIAAQIDELTRIGNTVEFNGKKLIDGSFQNIEVQVGAQANQSIEISIGDFRAAGMGKLASLSSDSIATVTPGGLGLDGVGAVNTAFTPTTNAINLNGYTVGSAAGLDTVSFALNEGSAIAKAAAINTLSTQTGVSAEATATTFTSTATIAAGGAYTGIFTINGEVIINNDLTTTINDGSFAFRNAINAKSNSTGVIATLNGANNIVLTAEDGRNITVEQSVTSVNILGFGATVATPSTAGGGITLTGTRDIAITMVGSGDVLGFTALSQAAVVDPNSAVNNIDVTVAGGADLGILTIDAALMEVADAQGQLGALTNRLLNTIANLEISIENMAAAESRIRDADFAIETANLTRAQIIQQASIAVLSQANLAPQAALALLG